VVEDIAVKKFTFAMSSPDEFFCVCRCIRLHLGMSWADIFRPETCDLTCGIWTPSNIMAHPTPHTKRHLDRSAVYLHRSRQRVPIVYNGPPLSSSPSKLPLCVGVLGAHLTRGSLVHPSPQPKRQVDQFSCFCRAHDRDRYSDRQRD